eukprot:4056693-Ditylum_brightwellii.AAC.1
MVQETTSPWPHNQHFKTNKVMKLFQLQGIANQPLLLVANPDKALNEAAKNRTKRSGARKRLKSPNCTDICVVMNDNWREAHQRLIRLKDGERK